MQVHPNGEDTEDQIRPKGLFPPSRPQKTVDNAHCAPQNKAGHKSPEGQLRRHQPISRRHKLTVALGSS
jgi:hypothetical protein